MQRLQKNTIDAIFIILSLSQFANASKLIHICSFAIDLTYIRAVAQIEDDCLSPTA